MREKRLAHVKEPEKQSRTCDGDVPEPPKEQRYVSRTGNIKNKIVDKLQEDDAGSVAYPQMARRRRPPKPVDEDLYKISPDLLRTTKRVSVSDSLSLPCWYGWSIYEDCRFDECFDTFSSHIDSEEDAGVHLKMSGSGLLSLSSSSRSSASENSRMFTLSFF